MSYRNVLIAVLLLSAAPCFGQVVLKLTNQGPLVFTDITINGRHAVMLVDTGSSLTIVRREFTKAHPVSSVAATNFASTSRIPLTDASIEIGNGQNYLMPIGVNDIKGFSGGDGILGSDFLRYFKRVEFDYKRGTLTLWN